MAKQTILLVEDEKDLLRLLQYNLDKEGFRVLGSRDAESGLELARTGRPDLILLDIMLPGMDGLEMCRVLRKESTVPILFLTAKKSEVDRILGLRLGGDDYLTKPFSVGELLARISAILRRTAAGPAAGGDGGKYPELLQLGDLEADFARHEVRVKGEVVTLTTKEFDFLKALVEADGRVLSREHLLERIWGYKRASDIDTRTVDQHIARLRRKLGSQGARILTVPNCGYRIDLR